MWLFRVIFIHKKQVILHIHTYILDYIGFPFIFNHLVIWPVAKPVARAKIPSRKPLLQFTFSFFGLAVAAATTMPPNIGGQPRTIMFIINNRVAEAWHGDNKKPRAISGAGLLLNLGVRSGHGDNKKPRAISGAGLLLNLGVRSGLARRRGNRLLLFSLFRRRDDGVGKVNIDGVQAVAIGHPSSHCENIGAHASRKRGQG